MFRVPPDRGPTTPAVRLKDLAIPLVAVLFAIGVASGPAAARPDDGAKAAAIKAAFMYNFAKFASWPPFRFKRPGDAVILCVQRGDLHWEALESIQDKQIGDRPIRISLLQWGDPIDGCHVLFASAFASTGDFDSILQAARRGAILLVSDQPEFAKQGGHIGLVEDKGRLRFQVNLRSVAEADLKLSSQLLQLAEIVGASRN